jgi:transcriptional regulator with XRE-family HTH domain
VAAILRRVDDDRLGTALRALRIRKRWRQVDVAERAGVSPSVVGRVGRGGASAVPLGKLRRLFRAVDARLDALVRFEGAELGRLLDARHALMAEAVVELIGSLDGWVIEPEVSFSVYGERGIIDVLAWHPGRRMLLVIELKTEVVEIGLLLGKMDQRRRLAAQLARERGWDPAAVSTWVVIADSRTNRRALATHRAVLRAKFPVDGRRIRGWLRDPAARVDALGFLPERPEVTLGRGAAPVRRISRPRSRSPRQR